MQGAVRREKHSDSPRHLVEHRLLNPGERRLVARRHTQSGPAGIVRRDGALVPGAFLTRKHGAHEICLPVAELVMRKRTAHGGA